MALHGQVFPHHLSLRETGFEKGNLEISSPHPPLAPHPQGPVTRDALLSQGTQGSRSCTPCSLSLEQTPAPRAAPGGGLPYSRGPRGRHMVEASLEDRLPHLCLESLPADPLRVEDGDPDSS